MDDTSEKLSAAAVQDTPIGVVVVFVGNNGVCRVDLPGRVQLPQFLSGSNESAAVLARQALAQIMEYLSGKRRAFDVLIDWSAMKSFQEKVLRRTMQIPFGQAMTYGQLAAELGSAAASRAVGGALAHNPMPILIPCHRVVAANGRLTGFSAAEGIRTTQWLLELEGRQVVGEKLV